MKDLMMAVGCACALAWAGGGLRAEEAKVEPEKPRKSKPAPKPRKPVLRGMQAEMAKVCELSDEQIKQIDSVNAKRNKALAAHRKDNAEKIKAAAEAMKKAREAKDKEATKKAYEAQAAIRAEQSGIVEKFDRQVMDVLTDEQKQLWAAHEMARYLKRRYPKFEFTDDQIAKAIAAQKAAEADVPAGDAKAAAKARRALDEKIREDVLTGEQRATLAMRYVLGRYRAIKLTDEQKAKIKAAYVELAEGKDLTDRKVAAQFDRDLRVKVHSDVLTPAQRATLAVGPILGRYRAAKITDEQRIEIEAAYVKLAEGKDATDSKVRQQLQKDLQAKIEKGILSEDQKLALAVAGIVGRYRRAKLTDEQITQIKGAYVKAMSGVKADDRKARWEARKKLDEEIAKDILTDEQREAMKPKPRPKKAEK